MPRAVKSEMLKGVVSGGKAADKGLDIVFCDVADEQADEKAGEMEADPEGEADKGNSEKGDGEDDGEIAEVEATHLYPWENSELLCRELLNMYQATGVIEQNAGRSSWALACVRGQILYTGFVRAEAHGRCVKEYVAAAILSEMLDQACDGFQNRGMHFLSRSVSYASDCAVSMRRVPRVVPTRGRDIDLETLVWNAAWEAKHSYPYRMGI